MDISEVVVRSHRMKPGSVAQHLNGFATELAELGYTSLTINDFLISAIHFGSWLAISGRSLDDVGELTVFTFGAHRCKCPGGRSPQRVSRRFTARVQRFVDYLQQQGAIRPFTNSTETAGPLSTFRNWLLSHRGLAIRTVNRHERLIMQMLPALGADAANYNAACVRKVILDRVRGCRPGHAKTMVVSLRVYLRFLATSGACQAGLDHALPSVAEWKLSSLPRYLDAAQATRLID